jgi:hypothetical protein
MSRLFIIAALLWGAQSPAAVAQRACDRVMVLSEVVLDCRVTEGRRAEDCQIVSEVPANQGFGREALKLLAHPEYRVREAMMRTAVDGRVRLTIPRAGIPPLPAGC